MPFPSENPSNADDPSDHPVRLIRMKLDTPSDLGKALARLIRMSLNGALPTDQLGRYANAINVLHGIIRDVELEKLRADIVAIESRLA